MHSLETMEAMTLHQDAAYRKLYRWVKNECRRFDATVPEITPLMKDSINALAETPVLLRLCLEEIANTRNTSIVRSFLNALIHGGPNGM
jgi:hypothetical protein